MDPVQRIPRYTLMFRTMIKHMAPGDPQRKKLVQADEIASKIALAEADEQTKQAAIWYCLSATVDGFPPGLISNSRRFVDCIDVEDVISDGAMSSSVGSTLTSSAGSLHCTLFLFDDKLVIAKRPGNGEKSGRTLTGLDEMEKLAKAGGLPVGMKKSGMSFKGLVDVTDVVAADVGGPGQYFQFSLSQNVMNIYFYRYAFLFGEPSTRSD
jgi:protein ECT2